MRDNELPIRKNPRLADYDYSQNGCYFVTVCVRDRAWILSDIVGPDALIGPIAQLSEYGEIVDTIIKNTNSAYDTITIDKYVIIPNHIHLLLSIQNDFCGPMRASGPTLGTIIRAIKTLSTRKSDNRFGKQNTTIISSVITSTMLSIGNILISTRRNGQKMNFFFCKAKANQPLSQYSEAPENCLFSVVAVNKEKAAGIEGF